MKRFIIPLLILALGVGLALRPYLLSRKQTTAFDLDGFGHLPVLVNGRIKPFDTVARTTLLAIQGRQRVSDPSISRPFVSTPAEWLATVCFDQQKANTFPTFRIDSPELLSLIGIREEEIRIDYESAVKRTLAILGFLPSQRARFSFDRLHGSLEEIQRQARLADGVESAHRNGFQKAVLKLYADLVTYQQLQYSLILPESPGFLDELGRFQEDLMKAAEAAQLRLEGKVHDESPLQAVASARNRFEFLAAQGSLLAVPPSGAQASDAWKKTGDALLGTFETGRIEPATLVFAGLAHTWRNNQPENFNEIVRLYRDELARRFPHALDKSNAEHAFNAAAPFASSISLYVLAFLLGVGSWLTWPATLRRSGFAIACLAWLLTTAGIGARMWIGGYAPVTNLYSSALGVCWVVVTLCIVLELLFRNAVGTVAAGAVGFIALIIAHHLSLSGDTMEMMRAVLDSNFWLGTHVVTITIGYGAMFLAGKLAIIYILRGLFTRSLDKSTADILVRMVYGVVCFATLFSAIGTILGGIWADQSWGRFWGWDPKENGALIIVLWCAIILHSRWGGLVKARGLMALAVFGNIVTAWSWFGVNMLGVGLHSYGFNDKGAQWLVVFVISQLLVIAAAMIPLEHWKSFKMTGHKAAPSPADG